MTNPLEKNKDTLYTTPKMVVASILADVIWQMFSQTLDPYVEEKSGNVALYILNAAYPFMITLLIGMGVYAYTFYKHPKTNSQNDDNANADQAESLQSKAEDEQENLEICAAVLLGMAGFLAGYFLAAEGLKLGLWGTATIGAIGSAATVTTSSIILDKKQGKAVSRGTYIIASASFFITAFGWYLSYLLPHKIPDNTYLFPKNDYLPMNHNIELSGIVAETVISPLVTGMVSATGLLMLHLWKEYEKSQTNNKQIAASPGKKFNGYN